MAFGKQNLNGIVENPKGMHRQCILHGMAGLARAAESIHDLSTSNQQNNTRVGFFYYCFTGISVIENSNPGLQHRFSGSPSDLSG